MQITGSGDLDYDVLTTGGGSAGLNATLQLGRSHRSVLVCDTGEAIASRKVVLVARDASNGSRLSVPSAVTDGSEVGATVDMELAEETFEEERKNERGA